MSHCRVFCLHLCVFVIRSRFDVKAFDYCQWLILCIDMIMHELIQTSSRCENIN